MVEFLAGLITLVFLLLRWAIIIRIILSWLPMANVRIDPDNPFVRALYMITDPILEPLRPYTTVSMIDLSPIVAILGLSLIETILLMALGVQPSGGLLF
jgi:YggT family protein